MVAAVMSLKKVVKNREG